jgi:hypothetical protein
LWTLIGALFSRRRQLALIGFNWSNSVVWDYRSAECVALGFEDIVRFEHHITETWQYIAPARLRRDELVAIAGHVPNISATRGRPDAEQTRGTHPASGLFRDKAEIEAAGDIWRFGGRNCMDKHAALNRTAWTGDERGLTFIPLVVYIVDGKVWRVEAGKIVMQIPQLPPLSSRESGSSMIPKRMG